MYMDVLPIGDFQKCQQEESEEVFFPRTSAIRGFQQFPSAVGLIHNRSYWWTHQTSEPYSTVALHKAASTVSDSQDGCNIIRFSVPQKNIRLFERCVFPLKFRIEN